MRHHPNQNTTQPANQDTTQPDAVRTSTSSAETPAALITARDRRSTDNDFDLAILDKKLEQGKGVLNFIEVKKHAILRNKIPHKIIDHTIRTSFPFKLKQKCEVRGGLDSTNKLNICTTRQPLAPRIPGAGGLLYTRSWFHGHFNDVRDVFISEGQSKWTYVGRYKLEYHEEFKLADWLKQPPEVRHYRKPDLSRYRPT